MSQTTALYEEHRKLGATFTDFGGWDMPLKYGSELTEHRAVREAAGLFDLSHMGEVWITGADSVSFLNTALVGNFAVMAVGRAKYTLLCNEDGGIVDDLLVYRVTDQRFLVVPNAGNAPVVAGLLTERAAGFSVDVLDASADTSLIAVQGPNAEAIVCAVVDSVGVVSDSVGAVSDSVGATDAATGSEEADTQTAVRQLKYYSWMPVRIAGVDVMLARTGYTGEDGFELYLPNADAAGLWQLLLRAGEPHGLVPCGLAARDSLRLEAGFPLYGNELGIHTNPFEVGLGGIVSFKKTEKFVSRDALEAAKQAGPSRVLVGLRGEGRRAGRSGYTIHAPGEDGAPGREIGRITSGQPSPTLGYPIALAELDPEFAAIGTALEVDLRGKPVAFNVVSLPFYTRAS